MSWVWVWDPNLFAKMSETLELWVLSSSPRPELMAWVQVQDLDSNLTCCHAMCEYALVREMSETATVVALFSHLLTVTSVNRVK